jgi:hypothetical protein|tara:strand:+ start:1509 stop:2069 length:561 start_codon:yes stop_codon:yes gene_type:complete
MKKTAIILSMILTPFIVTSQSLFDKYEEMDQVVSVVVNQKMFQMLADFETNDPDSESFMNQAKNLKNLSVYTTSSLDITKSMEKDIAKYIKSSDLEELMRIKDGDSSIKFFILEGSDDNHVNELLMFVKGLTDMSQNQNFSINGKQLEIETVLLSLKGDIDLREVSKLTTKLNVPGGELLKKATKE